MLKKLEIEDLKIIRPYFISLKSEISDINLTNLYLWRRKYNFHYFITDGYVIIANIKDDRIYFSQPIGDYGDRRMVFDAYLKLKSYCDEREIALYIKKAEERFLEILKENHVNFEAKYSEDEQDYIYDFEELRELSGKKYHKKKNHVNKFLRKYENWSFSWYQEDDFEDINGLLKKWMEPHESSENILIEHNGILDLLKNLESFELNIGVIRVDGKAVAFIIGEIISDDMLLVHIEKADIEIEGVFTMIGYQLYNALEGLVWINREQDMGIEGLRKSKLSYNPVRFVKKYEILL